MILRNCFRPTFLFITCCLLVNTIHAQNKHDIKQARWLIGHWENRSNERIDFENWTRLNDSTYQGHSESFNGSETISSEQISLQQRGGKLYYIPTVKNQNGGKPVRFALTSSSKNQLVFENPEHDFPQKITYTQITKDSLVAKISGTRKGKQKAIQFPMKRVK